jgi:outer membrane lipoprotein SlyB
MNRGALGIGLALLVATAPAQAGCLKGAVVGGIAGHYAHHHAVLGAIAGCAIGRHMTVEARKQKAAQLRAQQAHQKPQSTHP